MAKQARKRKTKIAKLPLDRYREVLDSEWGYRYVLSRDARFWEIKSWCKKQFGEEFSAWRTYDLKVNRYGDPDLEWWFRDQGDCMMFRLMWG